MWPAGGNPAQAVALAMLAQRFFEFRIGCPSGGKTDRNVQAAKPLEGRGQTRQQPFQRSLPSLGNGNAVGYQLPVPGVQSAVAGAKRCIPLLQRPVVAGPVDGKAWFHVEHQPVQPSTASLRPLVNQLVDLWVDR